ncbi:hypothetical protein HG531_004332 [Fusarium graminearum]|nr:hypothetical protein HG531_004332 [Fusarium graminearum]
MANTTQSLGVDVEMLQKEENGIILNDDTIGLALVRRPDRLAISIDLLSNFSPHTQAGIPVCGRAGISLINWRRIEKFWELVSIIDLHHGIALDVVLEALQLEMQHIWETVENDALVRILKLVLITSKVLVLSVHLLDLNVVLKAFEKILVPADVQLNVPEIFNSARFVVDINA